MAKPDWTALNLVTKLSFGENTADSVRKVQNLIQQSTQLLQTLLGFINVAASFIPKTIDPLSIAIDELITEIQKSINDLLESGFYYLEIDPDAGGCERFYWTIHDSVYDVGDKSRPQFSDTAYITGIVGLAGTIFLPEWFRPPDINWLCPEHGQKLAQYKEEAEEFLLKEYEKEKNPEGTEQHYISAKLEDQLEKIFNQHKEEPFTEDQIILKKLDDSRYQCPLDNKIYPKGIPIPAYNKRQQNIKKFLESYFVLYTAMVQITNFFTPPEKRAQKQREKQQKLNDRVEGQIDDPATKNEFHLIFNELSKNISTSIAKTFQDLLGITVDYIEMEDFNIQKGASKIEIIGNVTDKYRDGSVVIFNYFDKYTVQNAVFDIRSNKTTVTLYEPVKQNYSSKTFDVLGIVTNYNYEPNSFQVKSGTDQVIIKGRRYEYYRKNTVINFNNVETFVVVEDASYDNNTDQTIVKLDNIPSRVYKSPWDHLYFGEAKGTFIANTVGASGIVQPVPSVPPDWHSFKLSDFFAIIQGVKFIGALNDILQRIIKYLDILKSSKNTIVNAIESFVLMLQIKIQQLIGFANRLLIDLGNLAIDLQLTGFYFLVIEPQIGGIKKFLSILRESFDDQTDVNRPQFSESAFTTGFVILTGSPSLEGIQKAYDALKKIFPKEITT